MSELDPDRALVLAMPLRHLEAGLAVLGTEGSVVFPAGGPGDLDETPLRTRVLVIATEAGDAEVPAATWSAAFAGRVAHQPADPWPDGLPATWVEEHPGPDAARPSTFSAAEEDEDDDEEEEDDEDEGLPGPQSFLRVTSLSEMPQDRWIFANELVPKQRRRGRSFVPHVPRLIRLID
jgi:hypothetical protein